MGTHWNLRRVAVETRRPQDGTAIFYGPTKVREVFYEDGHPWAYADARLIDIIRFFGDWACTPVLRYPDDFVGEPDWLKEFDRMVEDALEEEGKR